jgi:hypothetical protein
MTIDGNVERLFLEVDLVQGRGDRDRGKLCIMSLVALLAGEAHTDAPATASAVIREFAMTINDSIPDSMRQRLKPFAPRIINTRDGLDCARANLLIAAALTDLLPSISADLSSHSAGVLGAVYALLNGRALITLVELQRRISSLASQISDTRDSRASAKLAYAVAQLICFCGRTAKVRARREEYWLKAIDLLDRVCDIRIERIQDAPARSRPAVAHVT